MTDDNTNAVLRQPIGFWTGEAHQRVGAKLRQTLDHNGLSQPQWWMVNHLESDSWKRDELLERLAPYNANEEGRDLEDELGALVARGLVHVRGAGSDLQLTEQGSVALNTSRRLNGLANSDMLVGVSDADLVTCINVLRVVVGNLGGDSSLR